MPEWWALRKSSPGGWGFFLPPRYKEDKSSSTFALRCKFGSAQKRGREWGKPQFSLLKCATITLKFIQFRKQLVSKCDEKKKKKKKQSIESIGASDTLTDGAINIQLSPYSHRAPRPLVTLLALGNTWLHLSFHSIFCFLFCGFCSHWRDFISLDSKLWEQELERRGWKDALAPSSHAKSFFPRYCLGRIYPPIKYCLLKRSEANTANVDFH